MPRLSDSARPGIGIVTAVSTPVEDLGGQARAPRCRAPAPRGRLRSTRSGRSPSWATAAMRMRPRSPSTPSTSCGSQPSTTGTWKSAPAEARTVFGLVTSTEPRQKITPWAPAASAASDQSARIARIAHVHADHQQLGSAPGRWSRRPASGRAGPRPGPAGASPCRPPAPGPWRRGGGPGSPAGSARSRSVRALPPRPRARRRAPRCRPPASRAASHDVGALHDERALGPAGGALEREAADPPHPGVTAPASSRGRR